MSCAKLEPELINALGTRSPLDETKQKTFNTKEQAVELDDKTKARSPNIKLSADMATHDQYSTGLHFTRLFVLSASRATYYKAPFCYNTFS
ncbi:MAG: hypothetical protein KME45_13750 [Stenomitos rutilans HA7619-LM2]|nr:hypothetical protein [Stenomitos rutilans HA7619-LM2]